MVIIRDGNFLGGRTLQRRPVESACVFSEVAVVASREVFIEDFAALCVCCVQDVFDLAVCSGYV